MGATTSKGKNYQAVAQYGQIFVQTEKAIYYGGETVSGSIYLDMALDFPGTQLFLKFKGKELIDFNITVSAGKGKTRLKNKSNRSTFLKQISLAREWGGAIPRGQYVIPFSFLLPMGLSGSFHQVGHGFAATKIYQVEAYLQPTDVKGAKLKYKQAIIIREPLLKMLQQHTQEVKQNILSLCCCSSNGTGTLRATFSKNILTAVDTVEVSWEYDNSQSKLAVQNMHVYLKQVITMKAEHIKTHEIAISHQTLPGVPAGAPPKQETCKFTLPQFRKDLQQINKRTWTKQDLKALTDDNRSLGQVTNGPNLSSRYALEVLIVFNYYTVMKVECPVDLVYPELLVEKVAVPTNWQPQTFDNYNFILSSYTPSGGNTNLQIGNDNSMHTAVVHPISPK